ncbi:MAG: hypothetical protein FWC27_15535 [Firmicutes bacterium]|nr:hypothetical protein [Bacillota bacterium]
MNPLVLDESDRELLTEIRTVCRGISCSAAKIKPKRIVLYDDGFWFESFLQPLERIGNLTCALSQEFREATRSVFPWGLVALLQTVTWVLNHYANRRIEWEIITKDLPLLTEFCDRWLETGTQ